eukprot:51497-Chlamydomonas_euryale.AAC.7
MEEGAGCYWDRRTAHVWEKPGHVESNKATGRCRENVWRLGKEEGVRRQVGKIRKAGSEWLPATLRVACMCMQACMHALDCMHS